MVQGGKSKAEKDMKIQFEFQEKAIRMLKAGIEELEESNQVGKILLVCHQWVSVTPCHHCPKIAPGIYTLYKYRK